MENGGNMRRLERELERFSPVVAFRAGDLIYSPCQRETVAYVIRRGRVKLFHLEESGKRLTLAILEKGSLFGEMALVGRDHRESSAQAMEEVSCWAIDRETLRSHTQSHPELALELLRLFLRRMNGVQERLKKMVFKDLETRLAHTLLHLAETHGSKHGDRWEIGLKITHQELAELVGGTRENVTTLLGRFESEGLIEKERFRITITDPEGLAARAAVSEKRASKN